MPIIKANPGFILEADCIQTAPGLHSVELHQTFPQAQRPRRQRLVQFNLNAEELGKLAAVLVNPAVVVNPVEKP